MKFKKGDKVRDRLASHWGVGIIQNIDDKGFVEIKYKKLIHRTHVDWGNIIPSADSIKRIPVEDNLGELNTSKTKRRCGICGKSGHNSRTCLEKKE